MIGKTTHFGLGHTLPARWLAYFAVLTSIPVPGAATNNPSNDLWVLKPVVRPAVPGGAIVPTNPIDAFVATEYRNKGLKPAGAAGKTVLLRRLYLDLTGLPPSPAEQDAFLQDSDPDAYEKVVDRLLSSEQHGVRYGRHWLDVLRYADVDERMIAAPGLGGRCVELGHALRSIRSRATHRLSIERPNANVGDRLSFANRAATG